MSLQDKKLIAAVIVFVIGVLAPYPLTGVIGFIFALILLDDNRKM